MSGGGGGERGGGEGERRGEGRRGRWEDAQQTRHSPRVGDQADQILGKREREMSTIGVMEPRGWEQPQEVDDVSVCLSMLDLCTFVVSGKIERVKEESDL